MAIGGRIGILTFHRCINYGSYWQARCLVEGLRAAGHDAVLLDHDSASVNRLEWRCALDPQRPKRPPPGDRGRHVKKLRRFLAAMEELPCSARFDLGAPATAGSWDTILVGSDEVWNLRHPWYGGFAAFYGSGFRTDRLVSYAASFGNQQAWDRLAPLRARALSSFDAISVRDENSSQIVAGAIGTAPEIVLDPCLQFPTVIKQPETPPADPSYVVVYGHTFPGWFSSAVQSWARATGYRLVSVGYRNDWADEQLIAAGPRRFAQLMAGAAAVATNFFHGCVFSILNGKPFVCASSAYRANKVSNLVRFLAAEKYLLSENADAARIGDLLERPLDPAIDVRVTQMRAQSGDFLHRTLA